MLELRSSGLDFDVDFFKKLYSFRHAADCRLYQCPKGTHEIYILALDRYDDGSIVLNVPPNNDEECEDCINYFANKLQTCCNVCTFVISSIVNGQLNKYHICFWDRP